MKVKNKIYIYIKITKNIKNIHINELSIYKHQLYATLSEIETKSREFKQKAKYTQRNKSKQRGLTNDPLRKKTRTF